MGSDPAVWVRGKTSGDLRKGDMIDLIVNHLSSYCVERIQGVRVEQGEQFWDHSHGPVRGDGGLPWSDSIGGGSETCGHILDTFKSRADGIFWCNKCRIREKVESKITQVFGNGKSIRSNKVLIYWNFHLCWVSQSFFHREPSYSLLPWMAKGYR